MQADAFPKSFLKGNLQFNTSIILLNIRQFEKNVYGHIFIDHTIHNLGTIVPIHITNVYYISGTC